MWCSFRFRVDATLSMLLSIEAERGGEAMRGDESTNNTQTCIKEIVFLALKVVDEGFRQHLALLPRQQQ